MFFFCFIAIGNSAFRQILITQPNKTGIFICGNLKNTLYLPQYITMNSRNLHIILDKHLTWPANRWGVEDICVCLHNK